jgi:23S rRNA pseudouridine1911/1915/1917 synthase
MPKPSLAVLHEDNHLIVVNKPAGLPTQGVAEGLPSVVTLAKEYLKKKFAKPGNVFLGVVSRLDLPVSGVLVLARTSKAAARLAEQLREGQTEKTYWALIERTPYPLAGELSHWLLKDDRERRMKVVPPRTRGSQHARLSYSTIRKELDFALVEVRLDTGRKHQIRLQLATAFSPVLGDWKYGSRRTFAEGAIALHALRLGIEHPTTHERLMFEAPLPSYWKFNP